MSNTVLTSLIALYTFLSCYRSEDFIVIIRGICPLFILLFLLLSNFSPYSLSFLLHDLGSNICYICNKNRKKVANFVLSNHHNFLAPRFTVDDDFYQFYVYKIESSQIMSYLPFFILSCLKRGIPKRIDILLPMYSCFLILSLLYQLLP